MRVSPTDAPMRQRFQPWPPPPVRTSTALPLSWKMSGGDFLCPWWISKGAQKIDPTRRGKRATTSSTLSIEDDRIGQRWWKTERRLGHCPAAATTLSVAFPPVVMFHDAVAARELGFCISRAISLPYSVVCFLRIQMASHVLLELVDHPFGKCRVHDADISRLSFAVKLPLKNSVGCFFISHSIPNCFNLF
ncbi:uncharacterized protein LOC106866173 [Brachypodium distachyon]|uniref:uncharacterized protein LOC106866173 n=1 Tax=Brachypodium distachyon TaxID=15368 RepID=UPI00071E184A|nr:uncharacterized protein LOC106866173 [Brachypodium distachyon]|eukprot:XP_014754412.1 uncharacterized protein LOC106866173 [Brachypodium distachyon]